MKQRYGWVMAGLLVLLLVLIIGAGLAISAIVR